MGTPPNRTATLGRSLAVFGVLLMAIKVGLTVFDIAGGGSSLLAFSAAFFILIGVGIMFRSGALR